MAKHKKKKALLAKSLKKGLHGLGGGFKFEEGKIVNRYTAAALALGFFGRGWLKRAL